MRVIRTVSGATYEVDGLRIRRVNRNHVKRGDGDWQTLAVPLPERCLVGENMLITMRSLANYGPDDYGTERPSEFTTRITSEVVSDVTTGHKEN